MNYPVRKNPRLSQYDYNSCGAYFITICTHHRKQLFSRISVGAIHESPVLKLMEYGKIVDFFIHNMMERFPVFVDQYVIMPNHVHLLIRIEYEHTQRAILESPLHRRSVLSKAVGYLKMNITKKIHESGYEGSVWQRSFHDHIIRNQSGYEKIWMYIENNPAKWEEDCFYINDR